MPSRCTPLSTVATSHPHIASQIVSPVLAETATPGIDRAITFQCTRCRTLFRKRVDNVVRSGRAICRGCSASPESVAEQRAMQRTEIVMGRLKAQGAVQSYTITKNRKVSVAELASVGKVAAKSPLRWDITVVAKVGAADEVGGLQTQLVHIELDGWQHFRFSKLWHKDSKATYNRSLECDRTKDAIVCNSTTSRYGQRFRRISLLRAALVKPKLSQQERHGKHRHKRQSRRDKRHAVNEAINAIEPFLINEFNRTEHIGDNLQLHPPEAYSRGVA